MKWLNEFSLVMRSSVSSLRDKIEDPERMLHQLLIDMDEELDRVRASVAEAVADEIQMRTRLRRQRESVRSWANRAATAVRRGDDEAAKLAVEQQVAAESRARQIADEHEKQAAEVEKLKRGVDDLRDKIRQARQKKTLLAARLSRSISTQKINDALHRTHQSSAVAQFNRLQERVERGEAMTNAWDELDGVDDEADALERQFEDEERRERVEAELQRLRDTIEDDPGAASDR